MRERESDGFDTLDKKELPPSKRPFGTPTFAFQGAAWGATIVGISAYCIGLWNADTMQLNEKGYYLAVLLFGLFSAVSLQKTVRDRDEGIDVTGIYYGISWFAMIMSVALLTIGLWNAGSIILSEKGFYAMSFVLSLFGSVTVQKNIRDAKQAILVAKE